MFCWLKIQIEKKPWTHFFDSWCERVWSMFCSCITDIYWLDEDWMIRTFRRRDDNILQTCRDFQQLNNRCFWREKWNDSYSLWVCVTCVVLYVTCWCCLLLCVFAGLFPAVLNLASMAEITANATCGENGSEMYCKLVEHVPGKPVKNPQCRTCNINSQHDYGKTHARAWHVCWFTETLNSIQSDFFFMYSVNPVKKILMTSLRVIIGFVHPKVKVIHLDVIVFSSQEDLITDCHVL